MNTHGAEPAAEAIDRTRQFFLHALVLAALTLVAAGAAAIWLRSATYPLAMLAAIEMVVVMAAHYGRRDLIQRLALEPEASLVPAVQKYHQSLGGQSARDRLAVSINTLIADARMPYAVYLADRIELVEDQLRLLARELATPEIPVQARSLVACVRLLSHGVESPLLNPGVPVEQLHATLLRIRFGIGRRAVD
jgi:hypothetical protein